jgi:hypothetical protein
MKRLRGFLLAVSAVVFFLSTVWLGRPVEGLWNSPDETANAFWAGQVASGGPLAIHDVVIGLAAGAMHPRSMAVSGDALVPGSFPGLFLMFGALGRILKLPFHVITPIFTALAGLLFGALVSKLFDRRTGFWAAILFFTHPAVLYYGARGLFHNVLCLDLLVIAAALFALRPFAEWSGRSGKIDDVLGGFIFGWAILTRASEAVWAIPAFLAFLPLIRKDRWRRLAAALCGAALPAFLFLFLNASLYGSPFKTAYNVPTAVSATAPSAVPVAPSAAVVPPSPLLPFGLHPNNILEHAWEYGLKLFWWQSLLAAVGFAWWIARWRKADGAQKTYAAAALAAAAWLAVFYGSWRVMDRLDPSAVTIGTSYVRYFLPAYLAALPFAALALTRAAEALGKPWIAAAAVVIGAFLAVRLSVYAGDESLRAVRLTLEGNARKKETLLQVIEPDAVVMTERFDKLLVPERLRIIPATDEGAFRAAAVAETYGLPVYWYGLDPSDEELRRLNDAAVKAGLDLGEPFSPIAGETLYQLTRL